MEIGVYKMNKLLKFISLYCEDIFIFIGLIIAWLLDPLVKWLQGKKIPRIGACIIVYLLFLLSIN